MNAESPLLTRDVHDTIAVTSRRFVSCGEFLGQVTRLAKTLPDVACAINICEDRYAFMLGFHAALVRGQCNILLPSRQPGTVREALVGLNDRYVMHDGKYPAAEGPAIDVRRAFADRRPCSDAPTIPDTQLAAMVYTSGSTGDASKILKYWRTLRDSTQINSRYLVTGSAEPTGIVATVPPGHMWGLETSILLPLFSNTQVYSGNSLFPGDICAALELMPIRRMLISTPVHLRAIVNSGLEFPAVERVMSATAPLSRETARAVERLFSAQVFDMYGCSETGLLAFRPIIERTEWQFFDEFRISRHGDKTLVSADHLPETVTLADTLEFRTDGCFVLRGRDTDLIKIGGKRGSLAELTNRLLAIEGVQDGVIFQLSRPGQRAEHRLSALVVAPNRTPADIRSGLSEVVDPVFLPRPIRCVDSLPRSSTGKIRKADLEKLVGELSKTA